MTFGIGTKKREGILKYCKDWSQRTRKKRSLGWITSPLQKRKRTYRHFSHWQHSQIDIIKSLKTLKKWEWRPCRHRQYFETGTWSWMVKTLEQTLMKNHSQHEMYLRWPYRQQDWLSSYHRRILRCSLIRMWKLIFSSKREGCLSTWKSHQLSQKVFEVYNLSKSCRTNPLILMIT